MGPDWYGYAVSETMLPPMENTPEVVATAHRIRDGEFNKITTNINPDEEYDLVIVGGGMAGLGAAWHFKKHRKSGQSCLMLDNHPIFGGEAKENEFEINGIRMLAPQGANGFFIPPVTDDPEQASGDARYYAEFNIPRDLPYRLWSSEKKPLKFCRDNYGFLYWLLQKETSVGHFYNDNSTEGTWATDIWNKELKNTPLSCINKKSINGMVEQSRTGYG